MNNPDKAVSDRHGHLSPSAARAQEPLYQLPVSGDWIQLRDVLSVQYVPPGPHVKNHKVYVIIRREDRDRDPVHEIDCSSAEEAIKARDQIAADYNTFVKP